MSISPWATHIPARQPAGTPTEWKGVDALSWYDGSTWHDCIQDVNEKLWQRTRRNIGDDPPWTRVNLAAVHTRRLK
jgi:hypothetical protein